LEGFSVTFRADRIVDTVLGLDPLAELPRTGWLLHGVRPCESIADHVYGVAVVTMLLVDAIRAEGGSVDGELALRMALVHDAPEAHTGDLPMPNKTPRVGEVLAELEEELVERLLPGPQREIWKAYQRGDSLESRIVKAADKVHLMIKVLAYERHGRGDLREFWENPKNFDDRGIPVAREVFDAIAARAGRTVPGRVGPSGHGG
jgi:putative hydrolase of HD superfamily